MKSINNFTHKMETIYEKSSIHFYLTIVIMILSIPFSMEKYFHGLGYDAAWINFLNYANYRGAIWGKDTFFTYGPLGFLEHTHNYRYNMIIAIAFWIFIYLININCIVDIAVDFKKTKVNIFCTVMSVVLLLLTGTNHTTGIYGSLYILYVVFLSLVLISKGKNQYYFVFNILMVLLFFMKFSTFFMGIACLLSYCFFYIVVNKRVKGVIPVLACVPLSLIVYLIYAPSISLFFRYIKGLWNISSGYNVAMSAVFGTVAPDERALWVVIGVLLCIIIFFILWIYNKILIPIYSALISSLIFFFKLGFVRHGGNSCFIGVSLVFFVFLFSFDIDEIYENIKSVKSQRIMKIALLSILVICITSQGDFVEKVENKVAFQTFGWPVELLENANDSTDNLIELGGDIKEIIGEDSILFFPWELSFGCDSDINISWTPIIQNYSAYTEWCDQTNAEYIYNAETAPEYIMFSFDVEDGRYPLLETPRTWNAIKDCYEWYKDFNDWCLLKRKDNATQIKREYLEIGYEEIEQQKLNGHANQDEIYSVDVPQNAKYFSIEYHYNLLGYLAKVFWKIQPLYMDVQCNNEDYFSLEGRVILDTMNIPMSIDDIGRYSNYASASDDSVEKLYNKIKFRGDGIKFYKNITVHWYYCETENIDSLCNFEDLKNGYKYEDDTDINVSIDKVRICGDTTYIIEGYAYADWEYDGQEMGIVCDGIVYPISRVNNENVDLTNTAFQGYKLGVKGKIPTTSQYTIVIIDLTEGVYCTKQIDLENSFVK